MQFSQLSIYLQKLEGTTSRNIMIEILAELFEKAEAREIDKIVYLLQGRVAPIYAPIEFGMADKMLIKAMSLAYKCEPGEVLKLYKETGDLGDVAEELNSKLKTQNSKLTVEEVFNELEKVAKSNGKGSVETKIATLSNMLKSLDSLSARYVARIPIAKLRLGFSDMTVLDSLSWMLSKSKKERKEIEKAFNVRPDLGLIAKAIKEKGILGVDYIKPAVFNPILMARAERLSSGKEIIEKIGKCAIEQKFDGFRLQVHLKKLKVESGELRVEVKLYTRNLEDATFMYPDVVEGVTGQVQAEEAILEGEAIAYHPVTGEYLPFQETVQRKRKYGIEEKAKEIPLRLICFDLLYLNGKSYINEPYLARRKALFEIIKKDETIIIADEEIVEDPKKIEIFFDDAISRGLEGILAKRLDGVYQAGARGWNWIKFKRSYSASLEDTIDALVMGYYVGTGKRTGFGIGGFLVGVYDKDKDAFVTIARVGTGLTDEEWRELYRRCQELKAHEKPPLYEVEKVLEPDVWVEPEIVVEIRADEITRSPIHTAGRILKPSKSGEAFEVDVPGYALRFPRLEKFRDDRKPEDATNLKEVEDMFKLQKK